MRRLFYSGRLLEGRVVSHYSLRMVRDLSSSIIRHGDNSISGSTVFEGDDIHFCNNAKEAFLLFLSLNNGIILTYEELR